MNKKSVMDASTNILLPFRRLCFSQRIFLVLALFAVICYVGAAKSFGQMIFTQWSVSEFQPNIKQGGRANTIAVHPINNNIIFVASETGGLFRSTDRGVRWRHVDSLPCIKTNSIAFVPSDPNILLVTTSDDFKAVAGGGIWRSTNGGASWTQSAVTPPPNMRVRLSAYEISIAPDTGAIYVGSEFGSLMSIDQGVSWTYQDVYGAGSDEWCSRCIFSILALGDNIVLAGGPRGIRRSINGGLTWSAPAGRTGVIRRSTTRVGTWTMPGGIRDIHSFGRSPISRQHAYVVDNSTKLFYSIDGGNVWTQIASAPFNGNCCGTSFIKTVARSNLDGLTPSRSLDLYFGNRLRVYRLRAPINSSTGIPTYGGTWENLGIDHEDTCDIAFDSITNPILLASDGGLHKTTDSGANWSLIGGGRNGYNALQIYEIKGQYIADIGRYDLYFGTQDNYLWSSGDGGMTWADVGTEGFYIEAERRVETEAQSKITFRDPGAKSNFISEPLFNNLVPWSDPPGAGPGYNSPMIIRRGMYIQNVISFSLPSNSGSVMRTIFAQGLVSTLDFGSSWQQFATFSVKSRNLPKLGRAGGGFISSIVYQPFRAPGWYFPNGDPVGFEINHFMRIVKSPSSTTADVYYPRMNNFGGLGINPTNFAWYQVFAIDPGDPFHVMAPDVINKRIMETRDGGENWTEIPSLTNLATDGGRLLFNSGIFPTVTAISFSPQNPRLVLAGTSEGGIYASTDNGTTWERINGSERVTYVTGFDWRSADDVIVSTYGRGLWRLQSRLVISPIDLQSLCHSPCFISHHGRSEPTPPPFDRAVLIFEGKVMGARIEAGILREVFVTPGSSVVFSGEDDQALAQIKVTQTNRSVGFQGLQPQPQPPQSGWIIKGLAFGKDNRLAGAIFGDKEMRMTTLVSEHDKEGNTKSPTAGKPYLQIVTKRFDGAPTASPDEPIQITGTNFPRGSVLEIVIDGQPLTNRIQVKRQGMFKVEIRAPKEFGLHSIVIRASEGQKTVLDGSMLLVKRIDDFKRVRPKPQ